MCTCVTSQWSRTPVVLLTRPRLIFSDRVCPRTGISLFGSAGPGAPESIHLPRLALQACAAMCSFLCGFWGSNSGPYACKHSTKQLDISPASAYWCLIRGFFSTQTRLRISSWPCLGPQSLLLFHRQTHPPLRPFMATSEIMAQTLALCVHSLVVVPLPFSLFFCLHVSSALPAITTPSPLLSFQLPGLGKSHPPSSPNPSSCLMPSPPSPGSFCLQLPPL